VDPDVIELTGNHVKDYGSQPMLDTLDMYCDEGWTYFGGGKDLEDARQPIVVRKKGTVFSFIGCNVVGPEYAWATADEPGAAPCDDEYVRAALMRLKEQTDVPVATLQYWEFYQYEPTAQQKLDFRALVDAGAVIVSGSQAHHPQAIEFYRDGFIHYGLGNLFFDQMWSLGTRQEVADRHVLYQGRHISTQLLTFMLEDYSQPRPMTLEERHELLRAVFRASGW
jgi:poly-gamma-glutamate synthesis protein (capsule biosynthesis protein)